jgi:hypothetical protein
LALECWLGNSDGSHEVARDALDSDAALRREVRRLRALRKSHETLLHFTKHFRHNADLGAGSMKEALDAAISAAERAAEPKAKR